MFGLHSTRGINWWASLLLLLAAISAPLMAAPREDVLIDTGWKFIRQDVPGAEAPGFGDAAWQTVNLPHCWNVQAGQDGDEKNFYKGAGWYRLRLPAALVKSGKSTFLRFEGAFVVTDVCVNGTPAGRHEGGFGAFCFDVTPLLHAGRDNVVAVRVQGTTDGYDGPPAGGDYTKFGGLYRDVHLLSLDPLSVSPLDDASPGVFLRQLHVSADAAAVDVTVDVRNGLPAARTATVRCRILDREGHTVKTADFQATVPGSSMVAGTASIVINKPHLWNGRLDPYLYRAVVDVMDGRRVTDRVEQPLGLRSFRVDREHGFFLNGKPYALHGVNRHQDRFDKGWAISQADMDEDAGLILEMGATCVRTCHYQQADYWHSLCDRTGIVLWSELCMVNAVHRSAAFHDTTRQQLAELIKQNYNHPSICFWSLWNEITFADKMPSPEDIQFLSSLNTEAHRLDPSRLTTGANNNQTEQRDTAPITDIIGWNGYPGWYGGKPDGWDGVLDGLRKEFPGRALGVSEYGAGASVSQHELDPHQPNPGGPWHPEEWQAIVHEAAWDSLKEHPYLWGTFIWDMFDFASISRKEGDHLGRNDKGLVTADRKTRKDAFYFYKAQWTDAPMVHINGSRYSPHPTGPADIKVYSNCDRVELFLDGVSMGVQTSPDRVFVWKGVTLANGTARLKAVGRKGRMSSIDEATLDIQATPPGKVEL